MNLVGRDLHQRDDIVTGLLVNFEHAGENLVSKVDYVITKQDCKGMIANVALGSEHCVTKTSWVTLAGVVDVG